MQAIYLLIMQVIQLYIEGVFIKSLENQVLTPPPPPTHDTYHMLDCKTVGFFLKISKEIGKAWRKSLTRAKRASLTRP